MSRHVMHIPVKDLLFLTAKSKPAAPVLFLEVVQTGFKPRPLVTVIGTALQMFFLSCVHFKQNEGD